MPFGYLTTVALWGCVTLFALRPPRPPRSQPTKAAYWLGFMANEVPVLVAVCLLASTSLAVVEGDIDSVPAVAAVAVMLATVAGLVVVAWRGLLARPALRRALQAGLGSQWSSRGPAAATGRLTRQWSVRDLVLQPLPVKSIGVERLPDIAYGDRARGETLDVYRRRGGAGPYPTLVFLHGGAFRGGDKHREGRALLHRFSRHGWFCISANYRLRPHVSPGEQIHDVKRVIAWARQVAPRHGADPRSLIIVGSSAGAHLAATAALTADDRSLQPGFERVDTSVDAVVCLYGYYGPVEGDAAESPTSRMRPDAPPFLIVHGDQDTIVLVEDAREFARRLGDVSANPVVYAELPGAQHTFDLFRSTRYEGVIDAVEVFASWVGRARR